MEVRKAFFSEEKKQKTFMFWCSFNVTLPEVRVFGFFQKERSFLTTPMRSLAWLVAAGRHLLIRARPSIGGCMAAGFLVSLALSTAAVAVFGRGERGIDAALMLTGRWAFLLFWPAFAGSGVVALLGGKFGFLRRYGRELGLAFAAAMAVHAALIAWLCAIGAAPARGVFVFFGGAMLCIYTLALFSLAGLQRRLGQRSWWLLRNVAMTYIAYAFATDFLSDPFRRDPRHILLYAPFALLSVLGFAAAAWGQVHATRKAFASA